MSDKIQKEIDSITDKTSDVVSPENGEGDDLSVLFEQRMNELADEEKEFVAPFLTPEFAEVIRIVFEEEAGSFFKDLADPDMVLVPMPRNEAEALIAAQQGQQQPQAAPVAAPQQATQPAPTGVV